MQPKGEVFKEESSDNQQSFFTWLGKCERYDYGITLHTKSRLFILFGSFVYSAYFFEDVYCFCEWMDFIHAKNAAYAMVIFSMEMQCCFSILMQLADFE